MKNCIHFGIWLLAVALLFNACKKTKPQAGPSFHLKLSVSTLDVPAGAGTVSTVGIEANSEWKITLPAGADWLQVNKANGTGNDNVQVTITKENNSGAARTATVTVSLVNGKADPQQLVVKQEVSTVPAITIDWKKVLGGSGNDYGYTIITTQDGGYLMGGRTSSNNNGDVGPTKGGIDMWVVKLNATGAMEWQKTFGGNSDEVVVAAAVTPDGGYVLTGYTITNNNGDVGANHGGVDYWVVKLNANGVLQWQKTLGGNANDWPAAVTVTSEGKIVVAGYTLSNNTGDVGPNHGNEDFWVVVLENGDGAAVWKKTFGGNGSDIARAVVPATDGAFFVGGNTTSNNNGDVPATKGSADFLVMKIDKNGSIVWKKTLGGSNIEDLNGLAVAPNNVLIAVGSTKSNNNGDVGATTGSEDYWITSLHAGTGNLNWQKTLGGQSPDAAKSVITRANGAIVVAGYVYSTNSGDVTSNPGNGDFWVVQLNANGNLVWKKALGGNNEEIAYAVADGGNGPVVAGYTLSNKSGDVGDNHGNADFWVVKLKEN
ncbi:MAG TPA: BACON domain-containing protein [Chitinophagaceae bacterium]|nr:BACON domain-containing protein [Chitinophagaceae bacterium]